MFKIGDFVKVNKRIWGVITDVHSNDEYGYVCYGGIKPKHNIAKADKITLTTRNDFISYIKRKGCTAMYQYC